MFLLKLFLLFVFFNVHKGDSTADKDEEEFEREMDPLRYHSPSPTVRLEEYLFSNYNPSSGPKKDGFLEMGILPVIQHLTVNQEEQNMVALILYIAEWQDDNLYWDPKDFNNITTIVVPSTKVWQPKLTTGHLLDSHYWDMRPEFDEFVFIEMKKGSPKATVLMQYRYNVKVDCNFYFENYPNDINQCGIYVEFSSDNAAIKAVVRSSKNNIDLSFSKYGRKRVVNDFHILNITLNEGLTIAGMTPIKFIDTVVYLKRHVPYFFAVFTCPIMICSLFNTVSFLAPTIIHSIFMSIATLLIEFIFLRDFISRVPPTVKSLPKCVQLYAFILFSSFLVLALHFISICLYQRQFFTNKRGNSFFWNIALFKDISMLKLTRTFMAIALAVMYSVLIADFLFLN